MTGEVGMDRNLRMLGTAVFLLGLTAACGSNSDSIAQFGSGDSFSVSAALSQIPLDSAANEEGGIEIYTADLLRASELGGGSRPTGSVDADETLAWMELLEGRFITSHAQVYAEVPRIFFDSLADLGAYRDEMGFTVNDVDASVESLSFPNRMTVLAGNIEPAAGAEVADGVFTFGDGEDFEFDPEQATVARPIGIPLRTASSTDLTVLSRSTDTVSAWLDAASPRLDSDEDLALVARSLDDRDVISAALFRRDFSAIGAELAIADGAGPALSAPFDTLGMGWAVVDGELAITVVYVFTDDATALTAAAEISAAFSNGQSVTGRTAISDLVALDGVTTQDRAVVVSLKQPDDPRRPGLILEMLLIREQMFTHAP